MKSEMTSTDFFKQFLNEIFRQSTRKEDFPFDIIAISQVIDDSVIIIYKSESNPKPTAILFDWQKLTRMFEGETPERIASAIVANEIYPPNGNGFLLTFDQYDIKSNIDTQLNWIGNTSFLQESAGRTISFSPPGGTL